jgi:hypothetical protein
MYVEHPATRTYRFSDSRGKTGSQREVGNEVAIHDVDVEGARPGVPQGIELRSEAQHVRGHQRREDQWAGNVIHDS